MRDFITIGGFDPSLRNFGMVKGNYYLDHSGFELTDMYLAQTQKNTSKDIRTNSHDLAEAKTAYNAIHNFFSDVDIVAVEIPVGSQSAAAMKSYGVCIGLLASFTIPLIQLTAKEIKKTACGNPNATKKDMISWATKEFPEAKWLTYGGKLTNANEHLADGLGAIYAAAETDMFKQMLIPFNSLR